MTVLMIGGCAHRDPDRKSQPPSALAPSTANQPGGRATTRQALGGFEPLEEINLVGSWRKEKADDPADNIFANNPFLEDLLEWRDSPEGQKFSEFADVLCDLMEDVQLDAAQRRFIWPDGKRLDLDHSVAHIQKQCPDFRPDWVEEYLIDWMEMDYAPEHYSQAQLDELDRLTAQWTADHLRRAKNSKKRRKTRHS